MRFRSLLSAVFLAGVFAAAAPADEASNFFSNDQVADIYITFDDPGWYDTLYQSHQSDPDDPYFPARFEFDGQVIETIGVRFKGNSSFQRNGVKKPFKLDFNEFDDDGLFLGLKKLNLHTNDLQPDYLRERLTQEISGKFVPAMRSTHVRLHVNGAFYGLYLAVEQPDKTMMQDRFGEDEDGNLYEAEEQLGSTSTPNLAWLGEDQTLYENVYLLKTNESASDFSGLVEFLDVLNNTPIEELPEELEQICDIENWLYGMALNNLFVNLDSYLGVGAEYYIYQRDSDGRFVHIQWDNNESFGITGDGTPSIANPSELDPFYLPTAGGGGGGFPGGEPPDGFPGGEPPDGFPGGEPPDGFPGGEPPDGFPGGFPGGGPGGGDVSRPFLERVWDVPEYRRLYLRLYAEILREGFNEATLIPRITELADAIRAAVYADPNQAYTADQFETALTMQVDNIPGLEDFVRQRYAFLRTTLDGYAEPGDVRLNELSLGDDSPWVELYNQGPGPVALAGMYLSDELSDGRKWELPAVTLEDGERLIIWLDADPEQGDTHASFSLTSRGSLYLFASSVSSISPVDSVDYDLSVGGQSWNRSGRLGSVWGFSSTQTPGEANRDIVEVVSQMPATQTLLINEIMADNDSVYEDPDEPNSFDDWIEIFNPGALDIDMSGMYLTDSLGNPPKWEIPAGVIAPAGGYVVFIADGDTDQGDLHAGFSLSGDGEDVGLFDVDGETMIDSLTFSVQQTDIAFGRTSDGAADFSIFVPGTPGAANVDALANWIVNGASYLLGPAAPEGIVSWFGAGLSDSTYLAEALPLPTELGGVSASVTDSAGATHRAPLYFVSPQQVNLQMPTGAASGRATVNLTLADGSSLAGAIWIDSIGAGVFSANATGQGVGLIAAVKADGVGVQTSETVFTLDETGQTLIASPIDLGGEDDVVYLVIYATGIRGVGDPEDVEVEIDGADVATSFAGPQSEYEGLDQINVGPLPRSLAGAGEVELEIVVDGRRTNRVTVAFE